MTKDASANLAEAAERSKKMLERLRKMASKYPKSISAKILESKLALVSQELAAVLPGDATDEQINVWLSKRAAVDTGYFREQFPPLSQLGAAQRLEFANTGEMPARAARRLSK